jgi:hypothetical protein
MRPTAYIGLKEAPKIKTSQWCVEVSTRRVGDGRVPGQVRTACIRDESGILLFAVFWGVCCQAQGCGRRGLEGLRG